MIYSRISGKNETYYESLDLEIWRLCCLYPERYAQKFERDLEFAVPLKNALEKILVNGWGSLDSSEREFIERYTDPDIQNIREKLQELSETPETRLGHQ